MLIITTLFGKLTEIGFIRSLKKDMARRKTEGLFHYNEIIDFSGVKKMQLSYRGIEKIAKVTSSSALKDHKTKVAIIVCAPLELGLARQYQC